MGPDRDEHRLLAEVVHRGNLGELRGRVARLAAEAGLDDHQVVDFTVAVNEALSNVIRHDGVRGELKVVQDDWRRLIAEVRDHGPGIPPWVTVTLPGPNATSGRGLWLAEVLADRLEIESGERGTTVRLEMMLDVPVR
jgi:anti-sigma regulatory factor (Ser/Thr protein kinase)